jgi:hypothetical protein
MYGSVACEHSKRWGTDAGNRRVLDEDICFFFIPMEELAKVVGEDVPITRAMTDIMTIFAECDYRSQGLKLTDLGMEGMSKREILEYLQNG